MGGGFEQLEPFSFHGWVRTISETIILSRFLYVDAIWAHHTISSTLWKKCMMRQKDVHTGD